MSAKLTTEQILAILDGGAYPDDEWEMALERYVDSDDELNDAKGAARFLEAYDPGRAWEAGEFHGLMYHHFTSRWASAAVFGAVRAREQFEDEKISAERRDEIIASDESAAAYAYSFRGTQVFTDTDGTVLVFADMRDGIEFEPVGE